MMQHALADSTNTTRMTPQAAAKGGSGLVEAVQRAVELEKGGQVRPIAGVQEEEGGGGGDNDDKAQCTERCL